MKRPKAIVYCENQFGELDGKVANGLTRHSEKYEIAAIIDSSKAGQDAGEYLDRKMNGIPIFAYLMEALNNLNSTPEYFIYGIAPLESKLSLLEKEVIHLAIRSGMNIVAGMPIFLSEDPEYIALAKEFGVSLIDVRKPPPREELHVFTGQIFDVQTPVITISGTDCAVGKRTTALLLVEALKKEGLKAIFITTGQTGILQGSKYGVAIDMLSSGFATGEVENAILEADKENPDIIVVEGQGALSHQAFTSSSAILRGAQPDAIILQHPPNRLNRCDYPNIAMPSLEDEIKMLEVFTDAEVIAITINHEDMTEEDIEETVWVYEKKYGIPAADVLVHGCDKLIKEIFWMFPDLVQAEWPSWILQD